MHETGSTVTVAEVQAAVAGGGAIAVDSDCHIRARWPCDPPVPDPESRAAPAQLLWPMDRGGIDRAAVICAAIGANPDNAAFALAAPEHSGGRLEVFADLECRWSADHRRPGAAGRLRAALARWPAMRGFTTGLAENEPGDWLVGPEGGAFFGLAAEGRLIASLSVLPHQVPEVARLATAPPDLAMLPHHLDIRAPRTAATPDAPGLVARAADCATVSSSPPARATSRRRRTTVPHAPRHGFRAFLQARFGPVRRVRGSDDAVLSRHMTYARTRAMVARHGPGSVAEKAAMLGGTMGGLLARAGA